MIDLPNAQGRCPTMQRLGVKPTTCGSQVQCPNQHAIEHAYIKAF